MFELFGSITIAVITSITLYKIIKKGETDSEGYNAMRTITYGFICVVSIYYIISKKLEGIEQILNTFVAIISAIEALSNGEEWKREIDAKYNNNDNENNTQKRKTKIGQIICVSVLAALALIAIVASLTGNASDPSSGNQTGSIYPREHSLYPTTLTVTDVVGGDMIYCETSTGIKYIILDMGTDIEKGDMLSAIMDENGTPDAIVDDLVVKHRYSGF